MPCREEGAATRVAEEWAELHGGGRVAGKVAGGEEKTRGGGKKKKEKRTGEGLAYGSHMSGSTSLRSEHAMSAYGCDVVDFGHR
jgi:hypothetical protein